MFLSCVLEIYANVAVSDSSLLAFAISSNILSHIGNLVIWKALMSLESNVFVLAVHTGSGSCAKFSFFSIFHLLA